MTNWNQDALVLDPISFRDIILSVYSNEDSRDKEAVKKTYLEMVEAQTQDSAETLMKNMDKILDELALMSGR